MKKLIFIAGGGTGGHIYPGIAIARALLKQDAKVDVHFVGTADGLETKILPREGFSLHLISGGKLNFAGDFFLKIKTLLKLPLGFLQAIYLIARLKPCFVLGVGGYASGPFVLAASFLQVPTAIWEPNAHPGMANRWLSRFVKKCYVVFHEALASLKNKNVLQVGMPVRSEIETAKRKLQPNEKFRVLSFGGSQGSRAISTVLSEAIIQRGSWTKNLTVVHQVGAVDFEKLKGKYQGFEDVVTPFEFIYDMPKYYSWADLVVARGGASTIMELAAFGIPAIIIPLPAADDHQRKNAESLVRLQAGKMIPQSELTVDRLIEEIQALRNNPTELKTLSDNIKKFFQPQAAEKIAQDILTTVGGH
jgi:UDP-N-acetylglucosamine--N-acetylmuramyl-(pentapeptide) pyrophosphoryl-undecaprenol N-acetylglucosamine transferase